MKHTLARTVAFLIFTAVTLVAADNSLGTWKLNPVKSQILDSTPMATSTVVIEPTDGGVKYTDHRERKDGTIRDSGYTVKYDGKDHPATGASYDLVAMKQVDANTFTIEKKQKAGKYHTTGRIIVSSDGKSMTITAKGSDASGKPTDQTFVYEKQ